jgi:hypothetical protein
MFVGLLVILLGLLAGLWLVLAGTAHWLQWVQRLANDYRRARHRAKYPYAVIVDNSQKPVVQLAMPVAAQQSNVLRHAFARLWSWAISGLGYTMSMMVGGVLLLIQLSIAVLVFVAQRMIWPPVRWLWQSGRRLVTRAPQPPTLAHLNSTQNIDDRGTFSANHDMNGVLSDGTAEHTRNGHHHSPNKSLLHDGQSSNVPPVLRSCFKTKPHSHADGRTALQNQKPKPSRSVVFVDDHHPPPSTENKALETVSTRYYDYETGHDALAKQHRTASTSSANTAIPLETAVASTMPILGDRVQFSHAAPRNNGTELSSRPTMPQSPGYKVVVQSSSLSTSVPSSGHKRVRALQEPLRVQRQQLLQQERLKRQALESTKSIDIGDPVAKRQRMQLCSNQGRIKLSALVPSSASRHAHNHLRPAQPHIQNASQKRARQEQLLEQLSQPPPKRFPGMGSYHGPFGRLNRSSAQDIQNGQPKAPAVNDLVTGVTPEASGATSATRNSSESNNTPASFTFGAHSSTASIENAVGTTEGRPILATETGAAENVVQTLLHPEDGVVHGSSETIGFSFGTRSNAPEPSDSAAPPAPTASTASTFSFGAQPTTNSAALSTLDNAPPANQTTTTTQPTVTFGDSSSSTDNAQYLFGNNIATNFVSTHGIQPNSGSGTEFASAAPVIQFGAPSNAAPAPTLTIAAPAVAPAFVFGSTSATTPPPGPVTGAAAVMGSFGTTSQFGMGVPPPPPVAAVVVPQFGANAVPQFGTNAESAATGPMVFGANAAAPSTRPPPRRRNALRARRT